MVHRLTVLQYVSNAKNSQACHFIEAAVFEDMNNLCNRGFKGNHHTESAKAARRKLKETISSVLFDMNVPTICAINQATLALYATRRTSGIVVNIGFHQTSVVPILHGQVMCKMGVKTSVSFPPPDVFSCSSSNSQGYGMVLRLKCIALAQLKVKKRDAYNSMSSRSLKSMQDTHMNLCYVALDYDAELSKDTEGSFEVVAEGWFTFSKERFQTGEILFQPRIAGM
ncbi:hypothetical protein HYC85_030310 [Camellia sinensis]|uniref:Uncharacterized protein n=1 Tax=Camellia sinensis TaxID=4442 RepID=A0A7J7G0J1_CAMSI|nr:hypothetical protein HYC85_030310 [Camellia sinensis]